MGTVVVVVVGAVVVVVGMVVVVVVVVVGMVVVVKLVVVVGTVVVVVDVTVVEVVSVVGEVVVDDGLGGGAGDGDGAWGDAGLVGRASTAVLGVGAPLRPERSPGSAVDPFDSVDDTGDDWILAAGRPRSVDNSDSSGCRADGEKGLASTASAGPEPASVPAASGWPK